MWRRRGLELGSECPVETSKVQVCPEISPVAGISPSPSHRSRSAALIMFFKMNELSFSPVRLESLELSPQKCGFKLPEAVVMAS